MTTAVTRTAVGLILHGGKALLLQRPQNVHTYGLWSLPGGKIEEGETLDQAVDRELYEELGIHVLSKYPLLYISGAQRLRKMHLYVFMIQSFSATLSNPENHVWTWAALSELAEHPTFKINLRLTEYLERHIIKDTQYIKHLGDPEHVISWNV